MGAEPDFEEAFDRLWPRCYRLARHMTGNREAAEDLTEEVFLKVLERLGSYQFRGLPFSAWLYRIARNHMIDHLRSRPRQVISSLDAAPEIPEKKAELVMDRSLDRHELTYALDRLTSDQRWLEPAPTRRVRRHRSGRRRRRGGGARRHRGEPQSRSHRRHPGLGGCLELPRRECGGRRVYQRCSL